MLRRDLKFLTITRQCVWTWGGISFWYRDGVNLWTHDGRHLGQFHGDEVYGPDGWYLGEIKGKDHLITNISKKGCRRGVFAPYAPRVAACARYANYVGYVM